MQSTLIIAGIAFLGAAIVGGGLVAFKVEIPLIESPIRQGLLGALGAVLLVAGFISGLDDGESAGAVAAADEGPAAGTTTPTSTEGNVASTVETTTTVGTTTTVATASSLPASVTGSVRVFDGDGVLGVMVPDDWLTVTAPNGIWVSPEVEDWVIATNGAGPSTAIGFHARRFEQPATGTRQEIVADQLNEMPVPEGCGFNSSAITDIPAWYYTEYRWYDCSSGGQLLLEATVDMWPSWVVLSASRYLNATDRITVDQILESMLP